MPKKQKLELTWIGKYEEPRLEPRILVEDSSKSYGEKNTQNMLIHGDNLLALKALEQNFSERIRCVFIDPPYNTGNAFEHYDDGLEHSLWLSLMRDRLVLIHKLLSDNGSLWITIDDNEGHYLKVICDEIFGRECFASTIMWRSTDNSNNDAKKFSVDHNMILVYSKSKEWVTNRLAHKESQKKHFKNPDNDPRGPWFDGNPISSPNYRENLCYDLTAPNGNIIKHPQNGWRWSKESMQEKIESGEIKFTKDGTGIRRRTYLADQKGLPPSTLWADLEETGHNRQAKYEQKKLFPDREKSEWFPTPKPERLISHILNISTEKGDFVLDSFLGGGTTAAVSHKMDRKWIGIELGEHCNTHCQARLEMVCDGIDQGGISQDVGWKGGGGFKFYELAPSLLKKDKYDNWVIDEKYNANMLASAMAKHEGFQYCPHEELYWKQGQSTEKDFIFTTTRMVTASQLDAIQEEMKAEESLLICCKSYQKVCENKYSNITIKKIPSMLLGRCEFGKEDYSLNIIDMPVDDNDEEFVPTGSVEVKEKKNKKTKNKSSSQETLF